MHFEYGSFDGMTDLYTADNRIADLPQTKYLFVNREMSQATKDALLAEIQNTYFGCENLQYFDYSKDHRAHVHELMYRLFVKRAY